MGTIQHACVLSGLTLGLLMGCAPAPETKPAAPEAAKPPATGLKPSRSGYAEVSGARFHYQIYGDLKAGKTPLLVLHGGFMSADSMMPVIQVFATTRPVIALDARGHGRTGDLPGPLTYEQMADDADAVLDALKVPSADVIGYSMGGITAIVMAARHPDKTGKQIILSGASGRDGFYPEVHEAFKQATPAAFAGSPFETEYKRLSPTPDAFPMLVNEFRELDQSSYDLTNDAIRNIDDKTMIIVGDADGVSLEHAIELFKLRGGGDKKVVVQGFFTDSPRARLAILPATSHVGIMAFADLIGPLAVSFLDDVKPPLPPGFFKE